MVETNREPRRLDAMRQFVVERMRSQNMTAKEVSLALEHYEGYISQWITKGSPRFLPVEQAEALCMHLRIQPAEWAAIVRQTEAEYAAYDSKQSAPRAPRRLPEPRQPRESLAVSGA